LVVLFTIESLTLYDFYSENHHKVDDVDRFGRHAEYRLFFGDADRELNHGLDWLRLHSKADDILVASMPHWAHIRTGLKTVMPPFERHPEKSQKLLDTVPVHFVIVGKDDYVTRYILPLIKNAPHRWSRIYTAGNDDVKIYERVNREDPQAEPSLSN
jgi:hypothetical protein